MHEYRSLQDSFRFNGVYMAEDLRSCYLPRFGGGIKKKTSFMETVKDRIDALHATSIGKIDVSDFTESTASLRLLPSDFAR